MTEINTSNSPFQHGLQYHYAGDLINAENSYLNALQQGDNAPMAQNNLGLIYFAKGEVEKAMAAWQAALLLDAHLADPLLNMGVAHMQMQRFPEALEFLNQALQTDPNHQETQFNLAQLHAQMGDLGKAQEFLNPLLNVEPLHVNAALLSAQIQSIGKNMESAKATLKKLLEAHPNLAEALINLAQLHVDTDDMAEARACLELAVEKNPSHYLANAELGKFLNDIGEENNALAYLKKATDLNPGNWAVYVHLGNSYHQTGHFDEALAAFRKALEFNPDDLGTRQNLSRTLARFVPPWHLKMLADHERNDAFEKAIQKAVGPDTVVLDIGTGSGLLSMMAARHGAETIYTCEVSKYIADVAKDIIQKNGYSDKIEVFNMKSTQLTPAELKTKPNLIVAEIFDAGLIGEMAIPTFRHALKQLCTDDCKIIPAKAQVVGRLLHTPSLASINPMTDISGFDLSEFDQFRIPREYVSQDLKQVDYEFLSDEFRMIHYDFNDLHAAIPEQQSRHNQLEVQTTRDGELHGVAFWFNLWIDEETMLTSHPDRKNNHWGQALYFFDQPHQVKADQKIKLNAHHNDFTIWFDEPEFS